MCLGKASELVMLAAGHGAAAQQANRLASAETRDDCMGRRGQLNARPTQ
jgi:hypothetical protein